jgi:hypothetical protein
MLAYGAVAHWVQLVACMLVAHASYLVLDADCAIDAFHTCDLSPVPYVSCDCLV